MTTWKDPVTTDWQTDDIPTETQISEQLLANLRYLKGQFGTVTIENAMTATTLFARRMGVTPALRHIIFSHGSMASSTFGPAGSASVTVQSGDMFRVLQVDNDVAAAAAKLFWGTAPQSTVPTTFELNVAKNPYMRVQFAIDVSDTRTNAFIGLRQSTYVGASANDVMPTATAAGGSAEHFLGLQWNGSIWQKVQGRGPNNVEAAVAVVVSTGTRHVIEHWVDYTGGTVLACESWLDGTLIERTTGTNQPSGTLTWTVLLRGSAGGGTALDTNLQVEFPVILQEKL